jgi:hypothetical protein
MNFKEYLKEEPEEPKIVGFERSTEKSYLKPMHTNFPIDIITISYRGKEYTVVQNIFTSDKHYPVIDETEMYVKQGDGSNILVQTGIYGDAYQVLYRIRGTGVPGTQAQKDEKKVLIAAFEFNMKQRERWLMNLKPETENVFGGMIDEL